MSSGINSLGLGAAGINQNQGTGLFEKRQQGLKDLSSALQSGNLDAAKAAFATLTTGNANNKVHNDNANSPLARLGQALQNGDLDAAKKAAATLIANRGEHHRDHGLPRDNLPPSPISVTPDAPPPAFTKPGAIINVTA